MTCGASHTADAADVLVSGVMGAPAPRWKEAPQGKGAGGKADRKQSNWDVKLEKGEKGAEAKVRKNLGH